MKKIPIGIIGMGGIGRIHHAAISAIPEFEIIALADVNPAALQAYPGRHFTSGTELIQSAGLEAVVIAAPHTEHPSLAVAALERGLHVMVEKPLAVHTLDGAKMVAAADKTPRVFAIMFQNRLCPGHARMKELIGQGQLGTLQRVHMIMTDWFRTDAYYTSAKWRATWAHEGGGILINQGSHNLDILQWLVGMPNRVTADIGFGKHHPIEVEDDVTAILRYPDGMTGVLTLSTGESPGISRLEIAGTRGCLRLENQELVFLKNEEDSALFCRRSKEHSARPKVIKEVFKIENPLEPFQTMYINFRDAVLTGTPLIAPARNAYQPLELANALMLSGFLNKPVDLPIDGTLYLAELEKRIGASKTEKIS